MEKINLSEILKHCPEGIKLWTDLYGEVELAGGDVGILYPISIKTDIMTSNVGITSTGAYQMGENGYDILPCILWPDSGRSWDEWQMIIMPQCVGKVIVDNAGDKYLVGKNVMYSERGIYIQDGDFEYINARFADEKEEVNFLLRLGENGFAWNKEQMKMEPVAKKSSKRQPKDGQPDSEPTELEPAVLDSDEADRLYEEYKKYYEEENPNVPEVLRAYLTAAYKVALEDLIETYQGMTLKIEK